MGKKLKVNLKVLVALAIILGAMLILGATNVQASTNTVITSGTPSETTLNNIPDEISLNIKESEYEQAGKLILNQVVEELKKQEITTNDNISWDENNYVVSVWFGELSTPSDVLYDIYNDIYRANIRIYKNNKPVVEKQVSIKYSNSKDYNEADKSYVENLVKKLYNNTTSSSSSYVIDIYEKLDDSSSNTNLVLEKLYKEINDPSITMVWDGNTAFDLDFCEMGYNVFRNGVLYYKHFFVHANQYYVTSNVDIGNNISVSGLLENVSITTTPIQYNDVATELKYMGFEDMNIVGAYELKLTGATELVNPIDITFTVGEKYNNQNILILHKKHDETFERFEKTVQDGKVTITVSELSPFVIAVKENAQQETQPTTPQEQPTKPVDKGEKDPTPKTGSINIIGYVLLGTIIAGLGIVVTKRNLK